MALKTRLIRLLSAPRLREIDRFMEHPAQVQQRQLRRLLDRAAPTPTRPRDGFSWKGESVSGESAPLPKGKLAFRIVMLILSSI